MMYKSFNSKQLKAIEKWLKAEKRDAHVCVQSGYMFACDGKMIVRTPSDLQDGTWEIDRGGVVLIDHMVHPKGLDYSSFFKMNPPEDSITLNVPENSSSRTFEYSSCWKFALVNIVHLEVIFSLAKAEKSNMVSMHVVPVKVSGHEYASKKVYFQFKCIEALAMPVFNNIK